MGLLDSYNLQTGFKEGVLNSLDQVPVGGNTITLDIETNSLSDDAVIHGVGIRVLSKDYFIPWASIDKEKLSELLTKAYVLVLHNGIFDLNLLGINGISFTENIFCTQIASWLEDENQSHKLVDLVYDKFKAQITEYSDFKNPNIIDLANHCKRQLKYTEKLYDFYMETQCSELMDIEQRVLYILLKMQKRGMYVDKKAILELEKEYCKLVVDLKKDIENSLVRKIDINSPKQLSQLLFEDMGIKPIGEAGKSGHYSTGVAILKKLQNKYPVCKDILLFREKVKTYNTFIFPLLQYVREDNRVHPHFKPTGTRVGRVSSFAPNTQQITNKEKRIRNVYVAPPKHKLLVCDYSQMHLRILAYFSKSPVMLGIFNDPNGDIHQITADSVGISRDDAKCYTGETELLTPKGWIKIEDLYNTDTEVCQYHPETKRLSFTKVDKWFKFLNQDVFHIETQKGDLSVTKEHRSLVVNRKEKHLEITTEALTKDAELAFIHAGFLTGLESRFTEIQTRVAVMVQADGSFRSNIVRLGFSKERKINRCEELLKLAGINYKKRLHKRGKNPLVTCFSFDKSYVKDSLTTDKTFINSWYDYNQKAFIDELKYWDCGFFKKNTVGYCSKLKINVDIIQTILVTNGIQTSVAQGCNGHWILRYSISDRKKIDRCRLSGLTKTPKGKKDVYCLSVPSTWVLTKRNNKVTISGNCVNFGIIYGFSEYSLAEFLKIDVEEAKRLMSNYKNTYPKVFEFKSKVIDFFKKNGYVYTLLGRRRRLQYDSSFSNAKKGFLEREAFNSVIIGTEADIMKMGMISVFELCKQHGFYIINQVHDELVMEIEESKINKKLLSDIQNALDYKLPTVTINSEIAICSTWGEKKTAKVFDLDTYEGR